MHPELTHPWALSEEQARVLQTELAAQVVVEDRFERPVETVVGVDVAYADEGMRAFAAATVFDVRKGTIASVVSAEGDARFPYAPGLLSFRELPILAAALAKLTIEPDLVICDGQGIAHPRRFGLASHLGVVYDVPTIGCAKTRLIGDAAEPAPSRGSCSALRYDGEVIGAVLRTRDHVRPLFVSPGHRISLDTACRWVLELSGRYRMPEPIRAADQLVNKMKRDAARERDPDARGD